MKTNSWLKIPYLQSEMHIARIYIILSLIYIITSIEKYMAQSRCIGLHGPFTNLPFWGCAMYFD